MARLVGGDKYCDQEDDPGEQEGRRPPQLPRLPLIGRVRPDYGDVVRGREYRFCLVFRQLRVVVHDLQQVADLQRRTVDGRAPRPDRNQNGQGEADHRPNEF